MREVVTARPGSAKAHYVYAEILAHNGSFAQAAEEAALASQIDPAIAFTDPARFRAFQQLLERGQHPPSVAKASRAVAPTAATRNELPGVPGWVWVASLAILGLGAWKLMSRNAPSAGPVNPKPVYGGPVGASPGYGGSVMPSPAYGTGMPAAAPSAGGGLLRTGAAVAGGVAAGMLLDEMLHRGHDSAAVQPAGSLQPNLFESVQPDTASAQLESRPIDFGNGDDWDAGLADGGGGATTAGPEAAAVPDVERGAVAVRRR